MAPRQKTTDLLAAPDGPTPTSRLFLSRFGVGAEKPRLERLLDVVAAFSRLPYENLTKIVKEARHPGAGRARRTPFEVVSEHLASGAGGTCFSLTATLLHLLRALGWRAEPVLADRSYGPNTHCALIVWIDERPHLLDPGFLILAPLPFGEEREICARTDFNEVLLRLRPDLGKIELHTRQDGSESYRLSFRSAPADAGEFLEAWDASFDWDMMRYPLLTRVAGGRHVYLQGRRLKVRSRDELSREEIPPEDLARCIAKEFGIAARIVREALEALRRRGEACD